MPRTKKNEAPVVSTPTIETPVVTAPVAEKAATKKAAPKKAEVAKAVAPKKEAAKKEAAPKKTAPVKEEKKEAIAKAFYLLTFNEDWADEHDVPALAVMNQKEFDKWSKTRLSIHAYLGNGGDNFMEDEQGLTGAQLIKNGTVGKMKVDESFAKVFKKAGLADLSLSNIFDSDNEFDGDDD